MPNMLLPGRSLGQALTVTVASINSFHPSNSKAGTIITLSLQMGNWSTER